MYEFVRLKFSLFGKLSFYFDRLGFIISIKLVSILLSSHLFLARKYD